MNHWPFFAIHIAGTLAFILFGLYMASAPRHAYKDLTRLGELNSGFQPHNTEPRLHLLHRFFGLFTALLGFPLLASDVFFLWSSYLFAHSPFEVPPEGAFQPFGLSQVLFLLFGLYLFARPADIIHLSQRFPGREVTRGSTLQDALAVRIIGIALLILGWCDIGVHAVSSLVQP